MKTGSPHPTSILVVDDNPGAAKTLKFVLASEGYEADCASTAADALAMAHQKEFDAALIDIALPDRSGIDLLPELKALFPDIIGIIVTGHASTETSIEALNRGASGYVQKPIQVQHLLGLLRSGLERRRLEQENARMLRRLSLLHSVGATVSLGLDSDVTLAETISLVAALLEFDAGAIWWASGDASPPQVAAAVGFPPAMLDRCSRHIERVLGQMATDPEIAHQPWFDFIEEDGGSAWGLRVLLLRGQQGVTGCMAVGSTAWGQERAEEAEVLGALAGQVGVAMENMRLYRDLRAAVAKLQEAQAQLVQSEKLSAIGRFIAGIAHEINNPLMAITGYSEILAEGADPAESCELAQRILQQAHRCARIVQSLVTFARVYQAGTQRIDLNAVAQTAVVEVERERAPATEVRLSLDPALPRVIGDPQGIQQALVNIVCNAHQAMADRGGLLTVSTRTGNGEVLVDVTDSGPGIPAEALPRVFDPFFTTRPVGKGTGLGLSVAHGIITEHGGTITAANHPQGGAVFTVRLPCARE